MARVSVRGFSISLDGYGAGPGQSLDHPLGVGGEALHEWMVKTQAFREAHGEKGGDASDDSRVDAEFVARVFKDVGAWIIGRNMFGPVRGPWPDENWKGWWGDTPPYHVPVFVLTAHPRQPLPMEGGTVFHFVTDGIEAALERARDAAGGKDVLIGGGVSTVRQYLAARLVDDMHLAMSPVMLGSGESLFAGLDLPTLGYRVTGRTVTDRATHLTIERG